MASPGVSSFASDEIALRSSLVLFANWFAAYMMFFPTAPGRPLRGAAGWIDPAPPGSDAQARGHPEGALTQGRRHGGQEQGAESQKFLILIRACALSRLSLPVPPRRISPHHINSHHTISHRIALRRITPHRAGRRHRLRHRGEQQQGARAAAARCGVRARARLCAGADGALSPPSLRIAEHGVPALSDSSAIGW